MKIRNYLLFLLVFVITCTLLCCTGKQVQLKKEKEVDCSALLADAKKALMEGKEAIKTTKAATFEFSNTYQCVSEDQVIFSMLVYIKHFDMSINELLCATLIMEVLAERKENEIRFGFGEAVVEAVDICEQVASDEIFTQ